MLLSKNVSLCDRCKEIYVKPEAGWVDLFNAATLEDFYPNTCSVALAFAPPFAPTVSHQYPTRLIEF
jgi:hypothetical protein